MEKKPLVIGELVAKVPLIQGGMGVGISLGNLAGSVAAEGGVGIISSAQIGFREPDFDIRPMECNLRAMEYELKKARDIAKGGIVGFNIMVAMEHYKEYVKKAVEIGADLIISGAGLPTELPELVKNAKTKIAPIVSTEKSAHVILKFWDKKYNRTADMVVIEGPKAGGHLGFKKEQLQSYDDQTYDKEVKNMIALIKTYGEKYGCTIPVVLAGGIECKEDVLGALALGVDAVQVASRFVTTQECDASDAYKQCYINAKEKDIVIVKSPVGMPGRAIRNSFIERVESGERIPLTSCHKCLRKCDPSSIPYCITDALVNAAKGNIESALLFCGAYAYKQNKITTVKEVIESLL